MAIIYQKEIGDNTRLGIWDIDEDSEYLLSRLKLNQQEKEYINHLKSEQRYRHWLGSRVLLKELLHTDELVEMGADVVGKPNIVNMPYNISISHSFDYAGVIISRDFNVAIDIEKIHPRIERVAHKFMKRNELDSLTIGNEIEEMYVHWCSKEVLFKHYGKGNLNFKLNILLETFEYNESGIINAMLKKKDFIKDYQIHYKKIDDYMLAYTIDYDPFKN